MTQQMKEKRDKRVNFKATETELKQYQELADKKGLTLSAYIRLLLSEQLN